MIPLRRQILINLLKLFDQGSMILAFALASAVTFLKLEHIGITEFLAVRIKIQNFLVFLGFMGLWYMAFTYFDLYRSRRLSSRKNEILDITKATTVCALMTWVVSLLFEIRIVSLLFLMVFWASSTGIIILGRMIMRFFLVQIRLHGRNLRHIVIVGTNPRALKFADKIRKRPELGYRLMGFVDDGRYENEDFVRNGHIRVTDFIGFSDYLRDHVVDEVIIGLPVKSLYDQASRIAKICEEQGIVVRFLSDLVDCKLGQLRAEEFGGEPIVTLYTGAMRGLPLTLKRFLDLSISFILLFVLSPLFLIVALILKIASPGPVFFTQDRIGLGKRRFRLYKFRTMVLDAEKMQDELEDLNEASGPVFKIKDDPRITKIGKILRKTSIDELPQLINVLKGDMSLVGPRPLPVRDYEGFDEDWHRRRFSVRPGITCLWQVNGRSDTPFEKWMELDMKYIDQWSFWLDIKILLKTIPAVIRGSGAA